LTLCLQTQVDARLNNLGHTCEFIYHHVWIIFASTQKWTALLQAVVAARTDQPLMGNVQVWMVCVAAHKRGIFFVQKAITLSNRAHLLLIAIIVLL
jgi:hypothetical protein